MGLRKITEKPKKKKGLGWFIIMLIILGFIASVFLFGKGWIQEIVHP